MFALILVASFFTAGSGGGIGGACWISSFSESLSPELSIETSVSMPIWSQPMIERDRIGGFFFVEDFELLTLVCRGCFSSSSSSAYSSGDSSISLSLLSVKLTLNFSIFACMIDDGANWNEKVNFFDIHEFKRWKTNLKRRVDTTREIKSNWWVELIIGGKTNVLKLKNRHLASPYDLFLARPPLALWVVGERTNWCTHDASRLKLSASCTRR